MISYENTFAFINYCLLGEHVWVLSSQLPNAVTFLFKLLQSRITLDISDMQTVSIHDEQ